MIKWVALVLLSASFWLVSDGHLERWSFQSMEICNRHRSAVLEVVHSSWWHIAPRVVLTKCEEN